MDNARLWSTINTKVLLHQEPWNETRPEMRFSFNYLCENTIVFYVHAYPWLRHFLTLFIILTVDWVTFSFLFFTWNSLCQSTVSAIAMSMSIFGLSTLPESSVTTWNCFATVCIIFISLSFLWFINCIYRFFITSSKVHSSKYQSLYKIYAFSYFQPKYGLTYAFSRKIWLYIGHLGYDFGSFDCCPLYVSAKYFV